MKFAGDGGGPPSLDLTHSKKYHRNYVQYCMLLKIFKTKKFNPFSQNWQQAKKIWIYDIYCTYQSCPEISTTAGQGSDKGAGLWGQGLLQTGQQCIEPHPLSKGNQLTLLHTLSNFGVKQYRFKAVHCSSIMI